MPVMLPEEEPEEPEEGEVTAEGMAALRLAAFRTIDRHSDNLFAAGVLFKGVILSLSLEAQARYHNMDYLRDAFGPNAQPVIPYPITFSSLDDTTTVTLLGPDDVHALYLTGVARVAEIVASGNVEKDYIRDATRTAAELRAFRDTRPLPSVIPIEP